MMDEAINFLDELLHARVNRFHVLRTDLNTICGSTPNGWYKMLSVKTRLDEGIPGFRNHLAQT